MSHPFVLIFILFLFLLSLIQFVLNYFLFMKVIQLKLELQIFARKYPNFKSKPIDRFQFVLFTYIFPFWASFREIISYERFLAWKKEGLRKHWADISKPKGGRPAIPWGLIKKIRKISKIDPTWGAEKIQNELAKLGESVSTETVRKYMKKKLPDPKKIARWEHFLRNLKDAIVAIDFFTIHSLWNFNRIFYAFCVYQSRGKENNPLQCN